MFLQLVGQPGIDTDRVEQHHAKEGRKDVPGGELVLALLWLLGRLLSFRLYRRVAVVAKAEKLQEAPTGRRFDVLGRLVEHVGLLCWRSLGNYRGCRLPRARYSGCRPAKLNHISDV